MRTLAALSVCAMLLAAANAPAVGAQMIVNEYNAVSSSKYIDGGDYEDAGDEDSYFATILGLPDGRIEGNGGNWIELVVTQDHLDARGWKIMWAETGADGTDGADVWYGNSNVEQGIITLSHSASIWSDLRAGTIITISEKYSIPVDTDWDGANRNFTDGIDPGDADVTIDLSTDTSFSPAGDDWWIHVSTRDEIAKGDPLVTTVTNVLGDGPGDFSVGPDDWQVRIDDDGGATAFGPIGEDVAGWGGGGINDKELGALEANPAATVTGDDYDDKTSSSFGQPNTWGLEVQDFSELRIPEPATLTMAGLGALALLRRRGK